MKKKKVYATHVTDSQGRRIYVKANTKEEFEKKVAEIKIAIGSGIKVGDKITFSAYANMWLATYKQPRLRETSLATLTVNLENHVIPYFGDKELRAIKPMDIQGFIISMSSYSKSVQSKCINIVKAILDTAVDNEYIAKSPFRSTDKPIAQKSKEKKALTDEQCTTLLDSVRGTPAYLFCLMGLTTGMRRSEMLGLTWENIDFEKNTISVEQSLTFPCDNSDAVLSTLLKSDSAHRVLPISGSLKAALAEKKLNSNSEFVFSKQNGEAMTHGSFVSMWKIVTARMVGDGKKLGDPIKGSNYGGKIMLDFDVTPHLLRHTYITKLVESGMDIKQVQYLAGHASPEMTLKVYTHFRLQSRQEATFEETRRAVGFLN